MFNLIIPGLLRVLSVQIMYYELLGGSELALV